jgi:hypothetical protein
MKKLNMFDYEKEIKMVSLAIIRYFLSSCDQLIGIYIFFINLFIWHISNYNSTFNHMLLPSHVI